MANNITIIVDNLASLPSNPYTYFNTTANKYYTYYAFSASTIVSADISASETFGEDFNIVSLPNIDSDVYAIRAEIEEYYYEPGEASARTCTYSGTVCAKENVVCTSFNFDINQDGCPSGPTPSFVTVSFDLNGHGTGSAPEPQTIETGGYATKPSNPTDSSGNYRFIGWYEANSDIEFNFTNTPIMNNTYLYANWAEIQTSTRSLTTLNSGSYSNEYYGRLVTISGDSVVIGEKIPFERPNSFLICVFSNETMKDPRASELSFVGGSAIYRSWSNTIYGDDERNVMWVGTKYRFVTGFENENVVPYGISITYTDTINNEQVTYNEIIKFNEGTFNIKFGLATLIAKECEFVAHEKNHIDVLFTEFPSSLV